MEGDKKKFSPKALPGPQNIFVGGGVHQPTVSDCQSKIITIGRFYQPNTVSSFVGVMSNHYNLWATITIIYDSHSSLIISKYFDDKFHCASFLNVLFLLWGDAWQ